MFKGDCATGSHITAGYSVEKVQNYKGFTKRKKQPIKKTKIRKGKDGSVRGETETSS